MKDLAFISGEFFDVEIPKDKQYLRKYFSTDVQLAFLRYYLVFQDITCFADHTGHACSESTVVRMKRRYHKIIAAHDIAKKNLDFEKVWEIESGNLKVKSSARG